MSKAIWRAGEIKFYFSRELGRYSNRETLSHRMAGAVGGGELVLGIAARSDLKAVADGWVELLDGRIEAHALSGVDSITNQGFLSEADGWRAGVEIENFKAVASECIHYAARVFSLFCRLGFFTVPSVAPARIEDRAIIRDANNDRDGEIWQSAPEQRGSFG